MLRSTLLLACSGAGAQTEVYCTVNSVKAEALTNATRVTISADGMIEGEYDRDDFRRRVCTHYAPQAQRAFPFRLVNARTK